MFCVFQRGRTRVRARRLSGTILVPPAGEAQWSALWRKQALEPRNRVGRYVRMQKTSEGKGNAFGGPALESAPSGGGEHPLDFLVVALGPLSLRLGAGLLGLGRCDHFL